jgi:hypothetical protein
MATHTEVQKMIAATNRIGQGVATVREQLTAAVSSPWHESASKLANIRTALI